MSAIAHHPACGHQQADAAGFVGKLLRRAVDQRLRIGDEVALGLFVAQLREHHQRLQLHTRSSQSVFITGLRLGENLVGSFQRHVCDLAEVLHHLLARLRPPLRLLKLLHKRHQFLRRAIRAGWNRRQAFGGLFRGGLSKRRNAR